MEEDIWELVSETDCGEVKASVTDWIWILTDLRGLDRGGHPYFRP